MRRDDDDDDDDDVDDDHGDDADANADAGSIVQIDAGYPYDEEKSVEVKIDKKTYSFYSQSDSAWTKTDNDVIYAMKKGVELTVKGTSSRGTTTIDTYTLKGFTAAFNTLSKGC